VRDGVHQRLPFGVLVKLVGVGDLYGGGEFRAIELRIQSLAAPREQQQRNEQTNLHQQRFADNLAFFQKTKFGEFHQNTSSRYVCTERKGEKARAPGSQRELLYKSNTVSAKDKNPPPRPPFPLHQQGRLISRFHEQRFRIRRKTLKRKG
jgi:hypothetical protein